MHPSGAIRTAYRVAARPQTYFIDRDGILRSIQVGEVTDTEFEKQYALSDVPEALRHVGTGHARAKVVITV